MSEFTNQTIYSTHFHLPRDGGMFLQLTQRACGHGLIDVLAHAPGAYELFFGRLHVQLDLPKPIASWLATRWAGKVDWVLGERRVKTSLPSAN